MLSRWQLVQHFGGAALALGAGDLWPTLAVAAGAAEQRPNLSPDLPAGTRAEAILEALPGKKPLIKLTYRPPNYETPVSYLDSSRRTTHSSCVITSPTSPRSTSGAGNCGSAGRRSARPSS